VGFGRVGKVGSFFGGSITGDATGDFVFLTTADGDLVGFDVGFFVGFAGQAEVQMVY